MDTGTKHFSEISSQSYGIYREFWTCLTILRLEIWQDTKDPIFLHMLSVKAIKKTASHENKKNILFKFNNLKLTKIYS